MQDVMIGVRSALSDGGELAMDATFDYSSKFDCGDSSAIWLCVRKTFKPACVYKWLICPVSTNTFFLTKFSNIQTFASQICLFLKIPLELYFWYD